MSQAPNSASPVPVVAELAAGQTSNKLVYLDAAEQLVLATPFLSWQPAAGIGNAQSRVCLPTYKMVRAFAARCSLSKDPNEHATLEQANPLNLALSKECWSKVLTELKVSGLLQLTFNSLRTLRKAIRGLTITNPTALVIRSGDLALGEDFDAPAVPAAGAGAGGGGGRGRARGRGAARGAAGRPAQPPVPGPAGLAFLATATLQRLEQRGATEPFAVVAFLAGLLGPCLTRAARLDALAPVCTAAVLLAPNIAAFIGASGVLDRSTLAVHLHAFLAAALGSLAPSFMADSLEDDDLQAEGRDCFRHLLGGPDEKSAIEARRAHLAAPEVNGLPARNVGIPEYQSVRSRAVQSAQLRGCSAPRLCSALHLDPHQQCS